jgi:hypothetical protein
MYEVCLIAWIYEVELQAEVDWYSRCCDLNSKDEGLALVYVILKRRKRKNCSVMVISKASVDTQITHNNLVRIEATPPGRVSVSMSINGKVEFAAGTGVGVQRDNDGVLALGTGMGLKRGDAFAETGLRPGGGGGGLFTPFKLEEEDALRR